MNDSASLHDRIERLEREMDHHRRSARRYRVALTAMSCALLGGIAIAATTKQPVQDVIQTHRLEVLDAQGNLILAAGDGEFGGQLDVWSSAGQNVLRAGVNQNGGDMVLWGTQGTALFSAYADQAGGRIGLWNATGQRSHFASADANGGTLSIYDGRGEAMLISRANENGGGLRINHSNGASHVALGTTAQMGAAFSAGDANGRTHALMVLRDRGPMLSMFNDAGRPVLGMGAAPDNTGGFVTVANAGGRAVVDVMIDGAGGGRLEVASNVGPAVSIESAPGEGGAISLNNEAGRRLMRLAARRGGGLINMLNEAGTTILMAGRAEETGGGGLVIRNNFGIPIIHAGTATDQHGMMLIWDADGTRGAHFGPPEDD